MTQEALKIEDYITDIFVIFTMLRKTTLISQNKQHFGEPTSSSKFSVI